MDQVASNKGKKRLSDIIVELKYLTRAQVEMAIEKSRACGMRYGAYLLDKKMLTELQYCQCMAIHFNIEFKNLVGVVASAESLAQIPYELALKCTMFPFAIEKGVLLIAVHDPQSILQISELSKNLQYDFKIYLSPKDQIIQNIQKSYNQKGTLKLLAKDIFGKSDKIADAVKSTGKQFHQMINFGKTSDDITVSVTNIINRIIERAIANRTSDIHIEPDDDKLRIRERIDGVLHEKEVFPLEFHSSFISRLKVMASLDIAEKRISQDGRFTYTYKGESVVDFRVSTLPTVKGEKLVLRLLDKSNLKLDLKHLGMSEEMMLLVKKMLYRPHGILLVTGPTGSGKTTTVYSMLNCINDLERNIITVEDPVEYRFNVVNQVQVNTKVGLTFPVVLRTILRQDPDVMMIGEIRDRETADIAIRAALTGHLVISTLHTNDSLKTIDRLIDIGVEPYLIASALLGVVAQRLVRRLCPHCKQRDDRDDKLALLPMESEKYKQSRTLYKAKGCEQCNQTGYTGRVAIYEMFVPDNAIARAIKNRANIEDLYLIAKNQGFKTIQDHAYSMLFDGTTSIDEIFHTVGTTSSYEQKESSMKAVA
ncbi:MAG: Flp pilus assembly complex ATPase component TadA [Oligoflexia bacterium]|nr:Flp pilus assembly complex ATPase component TadA [Oligoflexia bacterium]MBF0367638.1 Flp pilus assembly complex ATPase component TadA [Oligoflexia bacterium]